MQSTCMASAGWPANCQTFWILQAQYIVVGKNQNFNKHSGSLIALMKQPSCQAQSLCTHERNAPNDANMVKLVLMSFIRIKELKIKKRDVDEIRASFGGR